MTDNSKNNNNNLLEWWHALPASVREWTTKIAVTIALAILWHWCNNTRPPQRPRRGDDDDGSSSNITSTTTFTQPRRRQQQVATKGISRLVLNPLPHDLVLEERIESDEKQPEPQDKKHNEDPTDNDDPNDTVDASMQEDDEDDKVDVEEEEAEDEGHETTTISNSEAEPTSLETRQANRRTTTRDIAGEMRGRRGWYNHTTSTTERPVFRNQSREHPGLDAFWYWCDVECSLFRIYSLGRKDGTAVHPPYIPRSRRGQVKVSMRVHNRTRRIIHVYWVNYKGREESKGTIKPGSQWNQQTWIEHPWVFRDAETDHVVLYYIPDRVIPTCEQQPTVDENDPEIGLHCFDLTAARPESPFWVHVNDPILPFPAKDTIQSPEHAVDWTLLHMHRMNYVHWDVLQKYLTNILHEPDNAKYRQIRIENPKFHEAIWQTPAKGLLLAMGFVEQGAYIELGNTERLDKEQVKQLSGLLFSVSIWRKRQEETSLPSSLQPAGADGYGRAGFGRAGAMS